MTIHEGSGNVFADLGLPNPGDRLAKADVAICIVCLIRDNKWTQEEVAARMGIEQPDVSNIVRGRLSGFSLDRLFQCLNRLDQDVEITIRPKSETSARAQTRVTTA